MNQSSKSAYEGRSRWSRAVYGSAVALALAGPACGGDSGAPVNPKSIALTAQTNTETVSKNLGAAVSFMGDSDAMAETLGKLDPCAEEEVCAAPANPLDEPVCTTAPSTQDCGVEGMRQRLKDLQADLDEGTAELVDTLKTKIFIDANVESQSETVVVYKVPVNVLCDDDDEPSCATDAAKAQPRLRVTSPQEGDLDVGVLLTANKTEAAVIQVYRDRLGVSMNLGNVYKVAKELSSPEDLDGLESMSGVVSTQLVRNGDKNYSWLSEVKESVDVKGSDGGKPIHVRLDASSKSWELRLDGVAKTITAAVNMGGLTVEAPLEDLGDVVSAMPAMQNIKTTDAMKFVLGGINGSFTFDGKTDLLKFVGLGFGNKSTSVDVNGKRIFSMDVNANANRRFDMTVSMADTSKPLFALDPGLEAVFGFNFESIKDRFSDLPSFLLNDVLTFKLANNPSIRFADKGIEVVSGSMSFTSTAEPQANISVAAGMCLIENETPSATGHDFLKNLSAGSCQ